MTDTDNRSGSGPGQHETPLQMGMTADPVVRTARLARRIRAMGAELRDIPGPKRDLIIKMWSRGDTPAEIAHSTGLPVARVDRILGLNAAEPAPSSKGGSPNGVAS